MTNPVLAVPGVLGSMVSVMGTHAFEYKNGEGGLIC